MAVTIGSRPVERPRVTAIGTILASAGVFMYFAGLGAIYLGFRDASVTAGQDWLQGTNIPLGPPSMMMFTLGLSCITMQWALYAVARNDRVNAYVAFGLTMLFGGAVINSQYWMYQQMNLGVADSVQAVLIYAITGSFLALLISAGVYLTVVTFRALGGQYGPHQHDAVTGVTIYWYVMVAIFAVIWIGLYVTK